MSTQLNSDLLERYIDGFYGYGTYSASCWLIGMEEGGSGTFDEMDYRLRTWESRGSLELDDVGAFQQRTGDQKLDRWFQPNPPLQPTWKQLIRLFLCSRGIAPHLETIRSYQSGVLGRSQGDTALLELLPLPSPSTDEWPYAMHSELSYLQSRRLYRERVLASRSSRLQARIREHAPQFVVFYSLTYRESWTRIAGAAFQPTALEGFYLGTCGTTLLALTKHPTATGVTNHYFEQAGAILAQRLAQQQPATAPTPTPAPTGMAVGVRVQHPSFGVGSIVATNGKPGDETIEVEFVSGDRKLLVAQIAPLTFL